MRLAVVLLFAVLLLAVPAASTAAVFLELDMDGVVGNGPDFVFHEVGSYFTADLWLIGDPPLSVSGFDLHLCNPDQCLEFQEMQYFVPVGWASSPVEGGACIHAAAWDPDVTAVEEESWGGVKALFREGGGASKTTSRALPITLPARVGTITYQAVVDMCLSELILDSGQVTLSDGTTVPFENVGLVVGVVAIGTIEASGTAWGALQGLFR